MSQFKKHRDSLASKSRASLFIGLTAGLAIMLVGFEWKTYDHSDSLNQGYVELTGFIEEIEPIVPSKRKAPTIKKTIIIDLFQLIDDSDSDPKEEAEVKKEFLPEIDFTTIELGDDDDIPGEDTINLDGEFSYNNLQNRPHFLDCADASSNNAQDQCTFNKIRWLVAENARYPSDAKDLDRQGVVMVGFVINEKGKVSDVRIVESVFASLDKEAMRAIKQLPKFEPGMVGKHPVRVYYEMPVSFKLH